MHEFQASTNQEISSIELENRLYLVHRLKNKKLEIIENWDQKVRNSIDASRDLTSEQLQDSLSTLFEHIISRLKEAAPFSSIDNLELEKVSAEHGVQRARLPRYSVSKVLKEYRILRQILFDHLDSEDDCTTASSRRKILDAIDEASEICVCSFSDHRSMDLRRSNIELGHFAAMAAHDLKSPLATMQGYIDLLKEELQIQENRLVQKTTDAFQRSVNRMTMMITSLLEYSSIESKMKPLAPVEIKEVLETAIESLQIPIEKSKAHIVFENPMPQIMGDQALLTQLFSNLIGNSIKFRSDADPFIYIKVQKNENFWQFTIDDNGIGFQQNQADKMFEIFKQLSPKHKEKGSGIGLAVCRKVVSLHGGKIWAEAKKAQGARIYFTLPVYQGPLKQPLN